MRILHTVSSLDPRGGGVAEAVRQLGAALVRAGHTTEVLTVDAPGSSWLEALPFPVHALGPSHGSYQRAAGVTTWLRSRRPDFDCVISHGLWQHHGFAAWRAWRGLPRVVFTHGMLDPWFKRTYPKKHLKKWLYWPWAEYRILREATAVLFTCEEERRLARESFWLYRANETISPLGIEEPPGAVDQQCEIFYERFPELRGRRIVLFLGRITIKKGCDLLIEAFAKVARDPDVVLVLAGPEDKEFGVTLRKVGGDLPIVWTGMLSGESKWGALRAAEVFILPSHQENFGIAVIEALACGTPVLLSDKVNLWREILADGAGLVADDTEAGATDLLTRWLSLPHDERSAMARRAQACFGTRYQIDQAAATLVKNLRSNGVAERTRVAGTVSAS